MKKHLAECQNHAPKWKKNGSKCVQHRTGCIEHGSGCVRLFQEWTIKGDCNVSLGIFANR